VNKSLPANRWDAVRADVGRLVREVHILEGRLAADAERALRDQRTILLAMLDVLDSFDRVFANIEPRENAADGQARIWVGNFRSVRRALERHLRDLGVVPIQAPDGKTVAGLHTIVETRQRPDLDDEVVLEELQRGYLWRGQVLRKSHVVAVKN
jgi:molecular chaperone GrpE